MREGGILEDKILSGALMKIGTDPEKGFFLKATAGRLKGTLVPSKQ